MLAPIWDLVEFLLFICYIYLPSKEITKTPLVADEISTKYNYRETSLTFAFRSKLITHLLKSFSKTLL